MVAIFLILAFISFFAQMGVSVNYNLEDYLPESAPSTKALTIMEEEFSDMIPNVRVMVQNVSIQEALDFKEKLASIDGVSEVTWLDDVIDITTPIEMADPSIVETYYKDDHALFTIHIKEGEEVAITDAIYELIGENNALSGQALDSAVGQKMARKEALMATAIAIPILIIILLLSTSSWAEPLFYLIAIGISVIINLGTNIFLGEISFVTQAVAPILQLAVSMDYAIFLLHSFSDYREAGNDPEEAMILAMSRSLPTIAASASTTFFGFMALSLMEFEIGADLGLNLVKGILLSFLSVMIFLPAFTLILYRWIEKTRHKPILRRIPNLSNIIVKLKIPVFLLVLIVIVPAFLGQSRTEFTYGLGEHPESTRAGRDQTMIEERFGKYTPIVLLVPQGDIVKEEQLVQDLLEESNITSVIAYVDDVGSGIPIEFLEEDITSQFKSNNYSRIIINTNTSSEGELAFNLIENVEAIAKNYYGDDVHLIGESVSLYDTKNIIQKDNTFVNLVTVITIAIVLLINYRSVSFPIILLLTIQTSVWINLSIPYFTNTSLVFIGYLIVSTIQLAVTVDYAILLADSYKEKRRTMPKVEAMKQAIDEKFVPVVVGASILSIVGFILWLTSTNPIVATLGLLIGRGALLAFIMSLCLLPALLILFDGLLQRTTWRANFYKEN